MNLIGLRWLLAVFALLAVPLGASAQIVKTNLLNPTPEMSLSSTAVDFARQAVGSTSAVKALVINNTGNAPLTIKSISLSGNHPGDFSWQNCVTTIEPGRRCEVHLRFKPGATGDRKATLTLTSNAPTRTVALSGIGEAPPPAATSYLRFSSGVTAIQKVTRDDGVAYRVEITVRNLSNSTLNWAATLSSSVQLTSLWGATHKPVNGYTTFYGNSPLAPNQSASWGYEGKRLNNGTQQPPAPPTSSPDSGSTPPPSNQTPDSGSTPPPSNPTPDSGSTPPPSNPTPDSGSTPPPSNQTPDSGSTPPPSSGGTTPPPGTGTGTGYRAVNGQIVDPSGKAVQIRGVNMYGFNADILMPQYLWAMGWREQIQQVKSLGFNSIRVPFVPDTLYVQKTGGYFDPNKNPEFVGKTPLQIMDIWLAELDRQGLYFVLDFHSVAKQRQNNTWHTKDTSITWNGQPYTEDDWVRDLTFVAKRYAHLPRFMGIDLYNEPTGEVRWGDGDKNAYKPENDWKRAAERAGKAVLAANPKLLVFVEGISANWDGVENSNVPINYGENIRPQAYLPLQIPNDKLVFAPHSYGPDVYQKSTFSHPDFPRNLEKDWEDLFGRFYPTHPVVMGEFGGRYGNGTGGAKDKVWQDAFVDYLIKKGMRGGFYWCYTPNSHDTGGILDDELKVREDKMALLRRLWGQ